MNDRTVVRPRTQALSRFVMVPIVAQDPSVPDGDTVLIAEVPVPRDRVAPGPRSHRFHVVDYDASTDTLRPPYELATDDEPRGWVWSDAFSGVPGETLVEDLDFHAHNVFAIASRTLSVFESALGRRLAWRFPSPQLFLVPHAFEEANAFYAFEDHALYFGYTEADGGRMYTCLSHDIVAHETTHAILDGLRPRYIEPGLPDQAAFHEALADIVALLSVFSVDDVVKRLLAEQAPAGARRIPVADVSEEALRQSALFGLAEDFGRALGGPRADALRRSVVHKPFTSWLTETEWEQAHRRGEILVAAVSRTLLSMWLTRLLPLVHGDDIDLDRAAEEGCRAAGHLLGMVARAIDYCPPVELEFADVLEAMLVSDTVISPDDKHGYRRMLAEHFASYGIGRSGVTDDYSGAQHEFSYEGVNFTALRADRDEVFRFLWQNAERLGIDRRYHLQVGRVQPTVRAGPDGLVLNEVVADYVQMLDAPAADLARLGVELPAQVAPGTRIQVWGGGVLMFDQFGMIRLHHAKPLDDWDRQSRRLAYLVRSGSADSSGRYGFALATPRGQYFAELHAGARSEEQW